jgi:DNA-binding NarL/FixJ family response regulator
MMPGGRVQHQPADAVIIDLHLRAGTGFDLLNRLKGTPALSSKLVKVVLTNFATAGFSPALRVARADYFFDKSLEFDRAIDVLDDLARHASGDSPT